MAELELNSNGDESYDHCLSAWSVACTGRVLTEATLKPIPNFPVGILQCRSLCHSVFPDFYGSLRSGTVRRNITLYRIRYIYHGRRYRRIKNKAIFNISISNKEATRRGCERLELIQFREQPPPIRLLICKTICPVRKAPSQRRSFAAVNASTFGRRYHARWETEIK
jgi:hypothetical protein